MTQRYAFSGFVLDTAAGELRRGDVAVDLRPKVYELLRYFVEHPAVLIAKEDLLDAIWGDVHVSDGSINRTVTELRHLLGDDPRRPRIIETVARRGYRFIADVGVTDGERTVSNFLLLLSDRTIPLRHGETILGRIPECDVQIIGPSVSRRHARITITEEGVTIEDLGSTNGTFIGELRLTGPALISDGAEIRLGKERLQLMNDRIVRARTEPAL